MASTADFKNGFTMKFKSGLWSIISFQHVKPGKGPAFVRTKLKNLESGKVIDNTFPSGHKIEQVRIEHRTYQYLYKDDMGYHFMNMEDYEQIALQQKMINGHQFLTDGQNVTIVFLTGENRVLYCDLPKHIILEVTEAEPGVKGNTATNATKPAKVASDTTINVPMFIVKGNLIKIDTATGSYLERVKS